MCGQSCGATGDPTARPLLMAATQVLLDIRYYCQILYCVSLQHVDIKHNIGQQKCCFPALCVRRGVHSPCLSVAGTASLNSGNILWPRGWRMINGHFSHPPASLVQTGITGSILIIIIIASHYHYQTRWTVPGPRRRSSSRRRLRPRRGPWWWCRPSSECPWCSPSASSSPSPSHTSGQLLARSYNYHLCNGLVNGSTPRLFYGWSEVETAIK